MERLFDIPALEEPKTNDAARFQALGASAELLLTSRLIELGHKVAIPVTDDDGVDLIVNYATLCQVKSSQSRLKSGALNLNLNNRRSTERQKGSQMRNVIRQHVNLVCVYARDSRTWWFIPREELKSNALMLSEHTPDPWREAWHVFDTRRGVSMPQESRS